MSQHASNEFEHPYTADRGQRPSASARKSFGPQGSGLVAAIAVVAVIAAGVILASASPSRAMPLASASAESRDPSRFLLNALLVPALDADALPLRWADPRLPSLCGPGTQVRVNHKPLVAGALVPDTAFELEWQANGCRPFGANGPRFDGRVQLTVYREDWGLGAIVEPAGLRVSFAGRETTLTRRSAAGLRFDGGVAEPLELTADGAGG